MQLGVTIQCSVVTPTQRAQLGRLSDAIVHAREQKSQDKKSGNRQ
jgi:hypothetical protein